jgi:hypothetical protein
MKPIITPIGKYRVAFSLISTNLILRSITTNKNIIPIAPAYTIQNKIGKNSKPNNNNKNAALIKANINQNTL